MQDFDELFFLRTFLMNHTDQRDIMRSNELDQRPDSITPVPGLYDERYVIDDLREQVKAHELNLKLALRCFDAEKAKTEAQFKNLQHEIAELRNDNNTFARKLGQYAMAEYGQIPILSDITYLKAQVWYTPGLSATERRSKSVWSLRLTVDMRNHRLLEELNIRLFPLKQFRTTYKKQKNPLPELLDEVDALIKEDYGNVWAGCVQTFTRGAGRPYNPAQVAFLTNHEIDRSPESRHASLMFWLDGEVIKFGSPRPSHGDAGSSLWYLEWRPDNKRG